MAKTNYHNHTYLCGHAQGLPIDYVKRAVECKYDEIGISDHGPILDIWQVRMSIDDFYEIYLPNIELAQKKYGNKIKVYKGLELEYLEKFDKYYQNLLKDLDYLILGQHFLPYQGKLIDVYHNLNDELLELYKNEAIKAMDTGYFKIFAHPDIYLFSYREWNAHTEKIALEIIEAAIRNNVFLEINVNGIRRKRIINQDQEEVYIYPRVEFWSLLKNRPEAKILINEDNHSPKQIDDVACLRARQFAENLGLKISTRLFGENNE